MNIISLSEYFLHKLNNLSIHRNKGYPVEIGIFRKFNLIYKIVRTNRLTNKGRKTFRDMEIFVINNKILKLNHKKGSDEEIKCLKNIENWNYIYSFKVEDCISYTGEIYL